MPKKANLKKPSLKNSKNSISKKEINQKYLIIGLVVLVAIFICVIKSMAAPRPLETYWGEPSQDTRSSFWSRFNILPKSIPVPTVRSVPSLEVSCLQKGQDCKYSNLPCCAGLLCGSNGLCNYQTRVTPTSKPTPILYSTPTPKVSCLQKGQDCRYSNLPCCAGLLCASNGICNYQTLVTPTPTPTDISIPLPSADCYKCYNGSCVFDAGCRLSGPKCNPTDPETCSSYVVPPPTPRATRLPIVLPTASTY